VARAADAERAFADALGELVGALDRSVLAGRLLRGVLRLAEARSGELTLRDPDGSEHLAARAGRPKGDAALALALRNGKVSLGELRVYGKPTRNALRLRQARRLARAGAAALEAAGAHEAALRRADLDPLTGLANHGRFWASLDREAARAARYERALSVVMMDLDGFKKWNDQRGHLAGDAALVRAACLVGERSRSSDTAARYGGDEFALVLPEASLAGAITVAEKIRGALEAEGGLTLSAGVATAPADGRSAAELIRVADARLYVAKAGGGNRVAAGG
jgi:diguanylate cyclase (GGDEF)-like protein